jgi:hypothetical protein
MQLAASLFKNPGADPLPSRRREPDGYFVFAVCHFRTHGEGPAKSQPRLGPIEGLESP